MGTREQAQINGRKGGRPKAAHTITAENAKAELIRMYIEKAQPINAALLAKAESGDIQAIKELHDRVYGKAPQDMNVNHQGNVKHIISIDE